MGAVTAHLLTMDRLSPAPFQNGTDCQLLQLMQYLQHSQSASPIQHTVNLVFGYKVFLKVYFNVKIHAEFKSVCSQTQNVERFTKSMF